MKRNVFVNSLILQVGLLILFVVRPSNAIVECFWENEYNESIIKRLMVSLKTQCDTALGGGATFNGMYELVKSCTGSDGVTLDSADSGYGTWKIVYSCNTCTAKNIKKDVEDFKNSCAEQCRLTDYVCSFTNGEWGHSFPLPKICGKTDSTLSGCGTEESSSSVSEGSSDFQAQVRPSGLRCDPFGSDRSSCADRASLSGFLMYRKLWQDLRLWLRTEGRKFSSYEMSSAFFRVSERMDEELSRLKKRKQARSYNENGNSSIRAFGTRPFGGRCLYGHGDSQGDGFGSEGGSR